MNQYNDYFNRIFWINHINRMDRFNNMRKRIAELGLRAERFNAIDGGHVDRKKLNFQMTRRDLDNGELGCYLSHMAIYSEIIRNKTPKTLILEDDAEFIGEFTTENLPDDWELLYLGQWNYDTAQCNGETALKLKFKGSVFNAERCWLTHAYAITYEGAIKAYDYCIKITTSIDGALADAQEKVPIKTYAFYPSIIKQDGTKSSLRLNNR